MKKIYILLQLVASLYCGQLLMNWYLGSMHYLISLICIHLILYLISVVITKLYYKQLLLGLDIIYLAVVLLGGNSYALFMVLFLSGLEFLISDADHTKKLGVIGIVLFIGGSFTSVIEDDWLIYSVFLITSIFIYFNEERITQLTYARDTLMEQVSLLNKSLEGLKQEKKQMTYITKVTERNKLAQQLHDKLGHLLAGNVMKLEAARIIFPKDEEKGMMCLDQVTDSLREGMEEIRYTLKELKPALGESGLSKVKVLLQELKEQTGIMPRLTYKGDLESIDLERWYVISENLKEAITNFIKHSKGDMFEVSIDVMNKLIKVSFKDNGYIDKPITKSLGLMGIEERTLSIDGKLIINTEKGFETIMLIKR